MGPHRFECNATPHRQRARIEAGEPPHLYRGEARLSDGKRVQAVLYPRELAEGRHRDISKYGGWRAYLEQRSGG